MTVIQQAPPIKVTVTEEGFTGGEHWEVVETYDALIVAWAQLYEDGGMTMHPVVWPRSNSHQGKAFVPQSSDETRFKVEETRPAPSMQVGSPAWMAAREAKQARDDAAWATVYADDPEHQS